MFRVNEPISEIGELRNTGSLFFIKKFDTTLHIWWSFLMKTNFYFSWSSVNFKEKQILFVISNIDSKKILIL